MYIGTTRRRVTVLSQLKVLIADDDPHVREIIELYFKQNQMSVISVCTGKQAIDSVKTDAPDIVILDIMMPEMDGLEVCRRLREAKANIPIIMLSAKDEELDRVLGLEIGADDYLTKPFSPRELVARIKAVLRRTQDISESVDTNDQPRRSEQEHFDYGAFTLNIPRRELAVGDQPVFLRPKEFDLLVLFVQHPGIVLTRERILEDVWGYDYYGDMRTVDVHIKKLRQKLSPLDLDCIQTVWGVGYRFHFDTKEVSS
jgi:two-component system response regulator ResD